MKNINVIELHKKWAGTILYLPASQICFCLLAKPGADLCLAAGLGIGPRLEDPKSSVLPLNDPAMPKIITQLTDLI